MKVDDELQLTTGLKLTKNFKPMISSIMFPVVLDFKFELTKTDTQRKPVFVMI